MPETKSTSEIKPARSRKAKTKAIAQKAKPSGKKIAIILIRGLVKTPNEVKDTLRMLNLSKNNSCAVVDDTLTIRGMIKIIKDHIAYGEIDAETLKLMQEKRSVPNKKIFTLHPPRGGFERKGIKKDFTVGGALGNRGEKINDLIKKML